jgi:hypothetical protein
MTVNGTCHMLWDDDGSHPPTICPRCAGPLEARDRRGWCEHCRAEYDPPRPLSRFTRWLRHECEHG